MAREQRGENRAADLEEHRIDPVVENEDDDEEEDMAEDENQRNDLLNGIRQVVGQFNQTVSQYLQQAQQAVPPPPAEWDSNAKFVELFMLFRKLKAPFFNGASEPIEAEEWIRRVERDLDVLLCPPQFKVKMATYLLGGVASYWWEYLKRRYPPGHVFTWEEFSSEFEKQYYPLLKRQKSREFLKLEQGDASVREYANRFYTLLHFVDDFVPTEELNIRMFERGLRLSIRIKLLPHRITEFSELVKLAELAEALEEEAEREADDDENLAANNHFGGRASGRRHRANSKACFRCGETRHILRDCPQLPPEYPPHDRPNMSPPRAKRPATTARVNSIY